MTSQTYNCDWQTDWLTDKPMRKWLTVTKSSFLQWCHSWMTPLILRRWSCSLYSRISYIFYKSTQITSNLCSDIKKAKKHLRLMHPSLSNHPYTEYAGICIFHFSVFFFFITLWNSKQQFSNFEPKIREIFKHLQH